jgi:hypothetical protein
VFLYSCVGVEGSQEWGVDRWRWRSQGSLRGYLAKESVWSNLWILDSILKARWCQELPVFAAPDARHRHDKALRLDIHHHVHGPLDVSVISDFVEAGGQYQSEPLHSVC